jgi:hypothetical protein
MRDESLDPGIGTWLRSLVKRARLPAAFALATLTVFSFEPPARAAGPDPAAEAARLIAKLDVPEARRIAQDPLAKAKAAQQRAQNAHGAGDLQHATELDTLALTWAEVAGDLARATESEKKLEDLQNAVSALEQKAVRTQALLEQTIARRGRAEQNLKTEPATARANQAVHSSPASEAAKPLPAKPSERPVKK